MCSRDLLWLIVVMVVVLIIGCSENSVFFLSFKCDVLLKIVSGEVFDLLFWNIFLLVDLDKDGKVDRVDNEVLLYY